MDRDDLLITTAALEERLGDPGLRILDVRYALDDPDAGRRAHAEARIPGAAYLHWLDDWSDPEDPVEGNLAPPERFADALRDAGVDDGSLIVAYDDAALFLAARMLWALHVYGHTAARVLDGGWPAWVREGRPMETGTPAPAAPGTFPARPADPTLRRTAGDVRNLVDSGGAVLLDCRMDSTWEAAGEHIPGARRLPAPSLLAGDGTLRPAAEIAARAEAQGATADAPVTLYCGGGVSASESWLALRSAGFRDVAVYDGSWSEWSADPGNPREAHGR